MECRFLWVDSDNTSTAPFFVAITVLAICIALPGNILTAHIILHKHDLRNEPTYLLIASVCIADVLVASIVQPLFICTMLLGTRHYCSLDNVYYTSAWISAMASGVGVLPITLERYMYIVYPLKYTFYVTKKRAQVAITLLWVMSLAFGVLPLFWYDSLLNHSISLFIVLLISFLMVCSYSKIYSKVQNVVPVHQDSQTTGNKNVGRRRKNRLQGQATRTVFFVVLSFFLCWFPYLMISFIISLYNYDNTDSLTNFTRDSIMMKLYWGCLLVGYCNSAINVFIYGRKNSVLRREISNYFRKIVRRNQGDLITTAIAGTLRLYSRKESKRKKEMNSEERNSSI
ncbi:melanocortin receptor 5-like [Clytia hemisphaerica]|uniref:G-protein coupled receptors family 1 profile domain-containing protein n=1 Tax=Clytia hemisphaerica TaxID=252671 RepID=A0A7M5V4D7_9CNID|eukprot:TCONS_00002209-protein